MHILIGGFFFFLYFFCLQWGDCCDGTDEYDGKVNCPNTCWEASKLAIDKLKKKIAAYQEGAIIRKKEVENAKQAITKDEAELSKLKNEEKILKGLVQQLKGMFLRFTDFSLNSSLVPMQLFSINIRPRNSFIFLDRYLMNARWNSCQQFPMNLPVIKEIPDVFKRTKFWAWCYLPFTVPKEKECKPLLFQSLKN